MAQRRKLEVVIAGDARGLQRTLGQVEGFGDKLAGKFKGLSLGKTILGGAGVAVVGQQLTSALNDAREAEKINRVTAQLVEQTGGAANLTADQVARLSERLSQKIGVDDDLIQANANVLLSFKNVADQAGAGNDVFTQAIGLSQDMATVMGTDAKSATMQLAKALNDPTKGMSALSEAGIAFTKQQQDQIRALQESGDLLGAQKIILAEVTGEVGGAAEAAADPMDKLGVTIGNLKERLGTALIPILNKVAKTVIGFTKWVKRNADMLKAITAALAPFVAGLLAVMVVQKVSAAIGVFNAMLMANPIGLVVAGIAALVAGLVVAYHKVDWFRAGVDAAFAFLKDVFARFVDVANALWRRFGGRILGYLRNTFENIKAVVSGALNVVRGIIDVVTGIITGKWGRVWDGIKRIVSGAWDIIKGTVQQALNALGFILSVGLEAARTLIGKIWDGIVDYFSRLPGRIADAATGMFDGIKTAARAVINWLIDAWNRLDFGISIKVPDWVPGIGGKGFEVDDIIPDIPRLATGGTATRAGSVLVGEQGPEILNLPRGASIIPLNRASDGNVVHLHFPNVITLDQHAARQLGELIVRDRRNGGPISRALAGA